MCGLVKLDGEAGAFIPVEGALRVLLISATVEIETTAISEFKNWSTPHAATVVCVDSGMIPEIATIDFRCSLTAAILLARVERVRCHWTYK